MSAAARRSSIASSKKSSSPCFPLSAIASSYELVLSIALSKMVGFDVRPVTDSSSMYRSSVPLVSRSRVMLSSQIDWPTSWSFCVAFIVSSPSCLGGDGCPELRLGSLDDFVGRKAELRLQLLERRRGAERAHGDDRAPESDVALPAE